MSTRDQECLDLAVYAVNCTVAPEVLWPALLVFSAILISARGNLSRRQMERARSIGSSLKEVEEEQGRKRMSLLSKKGLLKSKRVICAITRTPCWVDCAFLPKD